MLYHDGGRPVTIERARLRIRLEGVGDYWRETVFDSMYRQTIYPQSGPPGQWLVYSVIYHPTKQHPDLPLAPKIETGDSFPLDVPIALIRQPDGWRPTITHGKGTIFLEVLSQERVVGQWDLSITDVGKEIAATIDRWAISADQ
jgi:hypothetical protein